MRYVSFTRPNPWKYAGERRQLPAVEQIGDVEIWSAHLLDKIHADDILLITDMFTPWDFEKAWPKIVGQWPRQVFCDAWAKVVHQGLDITIHSVNCNTIRDLNQLQRRDQPWQHAVTHCVNFMVNKYQLNRFLLLKLAQWFRIDAAYTWSGLINQQRCSEHLALIGQEIDKCSDTAWMPPGFRQHVTSKLENFQPHWIAVPNTWTSGDCIAGVAIAAALNDAWQQGLKDIVAGSAATLIADTDADNFGIFFTEKTFTSVAGLTFPIWLNAAGTPDLWKSFGFDIFEDVIDHSYQYQDNFVQRWYMAVHDNLDILTNRTLAQRLRQQHFDRLVYNRHRLFQQQQFRFHIEKQLQTLPEPVHALARNYYEHVIKHL